MNQGDIEYDLSKTRVDRGREEDVPEDFEGAIDPGVEVWLDAAFESEQATGKPVCAGGDR